MQAALDQFRANLVRVRDLGGLYASLAQTTTSALDLSDLLRAQIVLVVSAFDTLIHEITRLGILDAASGNRPATDALLRFQVAYAGHRLAISSPGGALAWLDAEIRRKHSFATFQAPDKVGDAIRLISNVSLWTAVGVALKRPSIDIKNELHLIVERRNKIAHEADADPSFPGARWPISSVDVNQAIDFIEAVGVAICSCI